MPESADAASDILKRLQSASPELPALLERDIANSPDALRSLKNLERWLTGTTQFARIESLIDNPPLRHRLVFLMGASQAVADSLLQNPDLAQLLGDIGEISAAQTAADIERTGDAFLKSATSYTHSLDRIRYLKQREQLKIVWNDLSGAWEPEALWTALSALADAVLRLVAKVVWKDMGVEEELPVAAIALGKHGTSELNYSSDIDLMFVCKDEATDIEIASKFCERFVRAVEGKMGRGALYRIDLRLRPLGKAGAVVQRVSAALNYYQNYCEPWEILAMIRARSCAGNRAAGSAFIDGIREIVYKGARTEAFLDEVVAAKVRYEEDTKRKGEEQTNLKLGTGGIRDIEFIVQMMQLLYGNKFSELRGASTMNALRSLQSEILPEREREMLSSSYRLYRQVEHRLQLRHDLQEHNLPANHYELQVLARLIGAVSWIALDSELRRRRAEVRAILIKRIPGVARAQMVGASIAQTIGLMAGTAEAEAAEKLASFYEEPERLIRLAAENPSLSERLRLIAIDAPRVVSEIGFHQELWDVAMSSEAELQENDEEDPGERLIERVRAAGNDWEAALSAALRREFVSACLKEAFHKNVTRTWKHLTSVADASLLCLLEQLGGEDIDVVCMGRLGSKDLLLGSDWDLMLLSRDTGNHPRAERIGQELMRFARRIGLSSGYFRLDARLRPEGSSGLMVRSMDGFASYSISAMETWERLAFTRARSLRKWPESMHAVGSAIAGARWTHAEDSEILDMRRRIQSERVRPWELHRNVKLGEGYQLDIEWLCGVLMLRRGEQLAPEPAPTMLRALSEVGALTIRDAERLSEAAVFYSRLRDIMFLLDFDSDAVLPENPDKLDRIAASLNVKGGNEVLKTAEFHRECVSSVFDEVIVRP